MLLQQKNIFIQQSHLSNAMLFLLVQLWKFRELQIYTYSELSPAPTQSFNKYIFIYIQELLIDSKLEKYLCANYIICFGKMILDQTKILLTNTQKQSM